MSNLRTVLTFAIPAVTALFGLLWIFRKKKPPVRKKLSFDDKTNKVEETGNIAKDLTRTDLPRDGNNSADDLSIAGSSLEKGECEIEPNVLGKQSESEQIGQPGDEILEEITPVLEKVLTSETVLDTLKTNPEDTRELQKHDATSPEHVSCRNDEAESVVTDALMSQIIVTDNLIPSIDREKDTKEVMTLSNDIDETEDVSVTNLSEINDKRTRLTEVSSTETGKSTQMIDSLSCKSVVENDLDELQTESPKQEDGITENVINSLSNEPTQMSRSWHEDVEEGEKDSSNGCVEEKGTNNNDKNPNNTGPPSDSDHEVQSDSTAKLAENNMELLSKEKSSLSPTLKNSSPVSRNIKQAKEESLNHSETSSNCDNSSEVCIHVSMNH